MHTTTMTGVPFPNFIARLPTTQYAQAKSLGECIHISWAQSPNRTALLAHHLVITSEPLAPPV